MAIRHTTADLVARPRHISALVAPLVADSKRIQIRRFNNVRDHTVGVVPFGQTPDLITDPSALRVPARSDGLFFNYYETWVPASRDADAYDLERAYLHLYLKWNAAERELQAMSLHCDPMLRKNEASYRYKRGPHLHVGGTTPNIDRAHISLCVGDNALGGNNIGALMTSLKKSVSMIVDEVIPHYR